MAEVGDPLATKPPDLPFALQDYECQECRQQRIDSVVGQDQEQQQQPQRGEHESTIEAPAPSGPGPPCLPFGPENGENSLEAVTRLVNDRGQSFDGRIVSWRVSHLETAGVNDLPQRPFTFLPDQTAIPIPLSGLQENALHRSSMCTTCKTRPSQTQEQSISRTTTHGSTTSIQTLDSSLPSRTQSASPSLNFDCLPFRTPPRLALDLPPLPFKQPPFSQPTGDSPGLVLNQQISRPNLDPPIPPSNSQHSVQPTLEFSAIPINSPSSSKPTLTLANLPFRTLPNQSSNLNEMMEYSNLNESEFPTFVPSPLDISHQQPQAIPDLLLPDTPTAIEMEYGNQDHLLSPNILNDPTSLDRSHRVPFYRRARDTHSARTGYVEKKIRVRRRRRRELQPLPNQVLFPTTSAATLTIAITSEAVSNSLNLAVS